MGSHPRPEESLKDKLETEKLVLPKNSAEDKQFVPFITPPAPPSTTVSVNRNIPSPSVSASRSQTDKDLQNLLAAAQVAAENAERASTTVSAYQKFPPPSVSASKSQTDIDLQDLLAAAQAAAENAERAAAAARSAANLAQLRINEFSKRNHEVPDSPTENPFHADTDKSSLSGSPHLDHQSSLHNGENQFSPQVLHVPSYDDIKSPPGSFNSNSYVPGQGAPPPQFQRLPSLDDEFSYPNLFSSQVPHVPPHTSSFANNSRSTHE